MMGRMKRFALLLLLMSSFTCANADPASDATAHHRDFQSEAEGIVIAALALTKSLERPVLLYHPAGRRCYSPSCFFTSSTVNPPTGRS